MTDRLGTDAGKSRPLGLMGLQFVPKGQDRLDERLRSPVPNMLGGSALLPKPFQAEGLMAPRRLHLDSQKRPRGTSRRTFLKRTPSPRSLIALHRRSYSSSLFIAQPSFPSGWDFIKTPHGIVIKHNAGSSLALGAEFRRYIEAGIVFVLFSNKDGIEVLFTQGVVEKVAPLIFGGEITIPPAVKFTASEALKKYSGT